LYTNFNVSYHIDVSQAESVDYGLFCAMGFT